MGTNYDTLTKEYIQIVNEMTTCMLRMDELKAMATEKEVLIAQLNKELVPKSLYDEQVVTNTDLTKQVEDLTKKVEEFGGKIKIAEDWGLKKLAYRIGKFEQAYYHIYALSIDSLKTSKPQTF